MTANRDDLEKEIHALRKINQVLMNRVEQAINSSGSDYAIFEQNILLQKRVEERTKELEQSSCQLAENLQKQKRISDNLRASESRYRLLFEQSPVGIFHFDKNGIIAECNDIFTNTIGSSREKLIGLNVFTLPNKKLVSELQKTLTGDAGFYEGNYDSVTGKKSTSVKVYAAPLLDKKGQLLGCVGIVEDITEHVEADSKLKESHAELSVLSKRESQVNKVLKKLALGGTLEEILAMILETAEEEIPDTIASILLVDKDGKRLCTDVKSRLPDYFIKAINGTPVKDKMGSCGTAAFRGETIIIENIQTHPFWKGVRELTIKAGLSSCWSQPIIATNGNVVGTFALYNNKPKRPSSVDLKLMETMAQVATISIESHRIKNEKVMLSKTLANIIDSMPSVLIGVDIDSRITQWNLEVENLTGIPRDKALGQQLETVYPQIENEMDELHKAILSKKVRKNIKKIIHQTGEDGYEDITIYPLHSNGMEGAVIRIDDVTERVRLEETMIQNDKMRSIGVLAGGIAHDFNNLLVGILGNLNLARNLLEKNNTAYPLLQKAEKASLRAKSLTGQLLTFSKGGAPVRQPVALDSLIKEASKFMLAGSNVVCHYTFPDDLWQVDVDTGQISQVVQNLIINAKEAMEAGGMIEVRCKNITQHNPSVPKVLKGEKYVQVLISDNGHGIPESFLSNIFDPYFSTKMEGSGLGLAVCHSIIDKHDGSIAVRSREGHGATFIFYLPASHADKKQPTTVKSMPKIGSGKVMIMDDEKLVRELTADMLTHLGYEIVTVSDGEEAIKMYKSLYNTPAQVDLIIMDLTIPNGMGGEKAVQGILEINDEAKVIVSSGYSTDPIIANFKEFGFVNVLKKPFDLSQLSQVVNALLT